MLVEKGELPHCKKGNRLYFFKQELLEWVQQGRKATDEELNILSSKADRFVVI